MYELERGERATEQQEERERERERVFAHSAIEKEGELDWGRQFKAGATAAAGGDFLQPR